MGGVVADGGRRATGQPGAGIARIAVSALVSASAHGQLAGARSRSRRAEDTSRAGMVSSLRRSEPTVAADQSAPAAVNVWRPRLWASTARPSQAALAVNLPDGRCASGPSLRSRMTSSTRA